MDPAPINGRGGLEAEWRGCVWLNPPYGRRNGIIPWLNKFLQHGHGVALVPNRTAAAWFQNFASHCDVLVFVAGKTKFLRPDGSLGASPGYGNVLAAIGPAAPLLVNSKVRGLRLTSC